MPSGECAKRRVDNVRGIEVKLHHVEKQEVAFVRVVFNITSILIRRFHGV